MRIICIIICLRHSFLFIQYVDLTMFTMGYVMSDWSMSNVHLMSIRTYEFGIPTLASYVNMFV